jgi:hypothetical protein
MVFVKDFMSRGQIPRTMTFGWLSTKLLEREGLLFFNNRFKEMLAAHML